MSYSTAPTHNPGETMPSADWNNLANNINSGLMRKLADSGELGAPAASVDFTSIPATFAHLLVVAYLRGDAAANATTALLRLNNDSAADYSYQDLLVQGAGVTAAATNGGTSAAVARIPGNTGTANSFATLHLLISHYAGSTNHKSFLAAAGERESATNVYLDLVAGSWFAAAAAINRLTLLPASGNFVAGSRVTLYGLPQ